MKILIAFLLVSVLWSGYWYQYNGDELIHAQNAYFITMGMQPFGDYLSIYTPVFHWVIAPTISIVGKSLLTLYVMRVEMILLFLAELLFSFLFLKNIFGKRVATVFLCLLLLDPFTTFAAMQIRPDALMLTLFVAGLWAMSEKKDILAGLLFGLSSLTAIKIFPALLPIGVYFLYTRNYKSMIGAIIPWILFIGYFAYLGLFIPMAEQLVLDIGYLSRAIQYPVRFGFFYRPDNTYIFGLPGMPLSWWYVWLIPWVALIGAFLQKKGRVLAWGMVCTFFGLLIPTTAFIQYYVPLYWFFAVFGAVALSRFRFLVVVLAIFGVSAIYGNIERATIRPVALEQQLVERWNMVPSSAPVFPFLLFRPIVYPIAGYTMGDVPEVIRRQFVQPEVVLEKYRVPFLYLNEAALRYYDEGTQHYIESHYVRDSLDSELMVRVKER